jgi:hypothetical protein
MAETTPSKADLLREQARLNAQVVQKTKEAASGTTQTVGQPLWTPQIGLQLSYSILVFGLIVLVLMSLLVAKYRVNISRLLRAFGLVLIIIAAIFLIVAGYNEQQIAPAMGLLGTIAGYLLGSRHSNDTSSGPDPDSPADDGEKYETPTVGGATDAGAGPANSPDSQAADSGQPGDIKSDKAGTPAGVS